MYFTTTQPSARLEPSTFLRTRVLNFVASQEAIKEQLMHILANVVDHEKEQNKVILVKRNAESRGKKERKDNEILDHIKRLGSKILEDQTLVSTLSEYRAFTDRVGDELRRAKVGRDDEL
jgi:hypothetical protein